MIKRIFLWIAKAFLFFATICMISVLKDEEGTPVILQLLSHIMEYLTNLLKRTNFAEIMEATFVFTGVSFLFATFAKKIKNKEE